MELKPGYKQTEVGVIPEDWDVSSVGEKGQVVAGKALAVNAPGKQRPYLRTKNVFDGRIDIEDVLSMPMTDEQFSQFQLRHGDVLLNEGQSLDLVGRCSVYKEEYPEPCAIQNALLRFRANAGTSAAFASHLFRHCQQTGVFAKIALQTTSVAHLGSSRFANLKLAWPTENEQRLIAAALDELDALLSSLAVAITKKTAIKQAAMQELLTGKRRLPGFEGEWEVKSVGDFADCTSGGTPATGITAYWGGNIRWMSSGELHLKRVAEVTGRITTSGLENSSAKLLPPKCVLVGLAGQGKTRGTTAISLVELSTNQSIAAILPNPSFVPEYLYYCFDSRYEELRELSSGSGGRGGLNLSLIKSLRLPMPTPDEQAAISAALSDMDCEFNYLEDKLSRLRDIKQGMMQQLLTGKIRLK